MAINSKVTNGILPTDYTYSDVYNSYYSDVTRTVSAPLNVEGRLTANSVEARDVVVNGIDVGASLQKIFDRLGIIQRNPELEHRWPELRDLAAQYARLEQEILEKERVWDILSKKIP